MSFSLSVVGNSNVLVDIFTALNAVERRFYFKTILNYPWDRSPRYGFGRNVCVGQDAY